jgi:integrase
MSLSYRPVPPFLRLLRVEDCEPQPALVAPPARSLRQTLRQFFEAWFVEVVLLGQRDDKPSALKPYREALQRWEAVAGDATLAEIDDALIAKVQRSLRGATYHRGPRGQTRPTKPATFRKWQGCLRAILRRLGPTNPWQPDEVCAGLLPVAPSLVVDERRAAAAEPKPCFSVEQAKAVMAACDRVATRKTKRRAGVRALIPLHGATPLSGAFFRAWFALLFYTGLRADKTALYLTRGNVDCSVEPFVLDVPARLVPKTEKRVRLPLHPCLVRLLGAAHGTSLADLPADALLCPWPMDYSHLGRLSKWVAAQAGAPALSPHAWRRTYGQLVAEVVDERLAVAAKALDHADPSTTAASYVSRAALDRRQILSLPDLW